MCTNVLTNIKKNRHSSSDFHLGLQFHLLVFPPGTTERPRLAAIYELRDALEAFVKDLIKADEVKIDN